MARSLTVLVIVAVGTLALGVPGHARGAPAPHPRQPKAASETASGRCFVIRHARVFDGAQVIAADSVFVNNGKIEAVGNSLVVPASVAEIDATGDRCLPA
jgi:hypothetical protein